MAPPSISTKAEDDVVKTRDETTIAADSPNSSNAPQELKIIAIDHAPSKVRSKFRLFAILSALYVWPLIPLSFFQLTLH